MCCSASLGDEPNQSPHTPLYNNIEVEMNLITVYFYFSGSPWCEWKQSISYIRSLMEKESNKYIYSLQCTTGRWTLYFPPGILIGNESY